MGSLRDMKRQWAVLWPDGSVLSADTAGGILNRLAAVQWDQPCNRAQLRARMVDRAKAWSGVAINEELGDEAFLAALADAGMFVLATPWTTNQSTNTKEK